MSSARLLLSGFLVAGGLILGAFTLHGYFDPQWAQKQGNAASAHETPQEPKAIAAFQTRTKFVASPEPAAQLQVVKATAKGDAKPADVLADDASAAAAKAAASKKRAEARKRQAEKEKRLAEAEKAKIDKAKQPPQQSTFSWLSNCFGK